MSYQYIPQSVYADGTCNQELTNAQRIEAVRARPQAIEEASAQFEEQHRTQLLFMTQGAVYPYLKNKEGVELLAFKLSFDNIKHIPKCDLELAQKLIVAGLTQRKDASITPLDRVPQSEAEQVELSLMPHINLNPKIKDSRVIAPPGIFLSIAVLCPEIKKDTLTAELIALNCPHVFKYLELDIRSDLNFLKPLIMRQPHIIPHLSDELRSDPELFKEVIDHCAQTNTMVFFSNFAESIRSDKSLALYFCQNIKDFNAVGYIYESLSENLKSDIDVLHYLLTHPKFESNYYESLNKNMPKDFKQKWEIWVDANEGENFDPFSNPYTKENLIQYVEHVKIHSEKHQLSQEITSSREATILKL